jgi:hypothetical protein
VAEEIAAALDATEKDVAIGGAGLAAAAVELGLVDELHTHGGSERAAGRGSCRRARERRRAGLEGAKGAFARRRQSRGALPLSADESSVRRCSTS